MEKNFYLIALVVFDLIFWQSDVQTKSRVFKKTFLEIWEKRIYKITNFLWEDKISELLGYNYVYVVNSQTFVPMSVLPICTNVCLRKSTSEIGVKLLFLTFFISFFVIQDDNYQEINFLTFKFPVAKNQPKSEDFKGL